MKTISPNEWSIIVLPRLKLYLQTPIPEKQLEELKQRPEAKKSELGRDKMSGHACTNWC